MRKILFFACAALAVLGCGGDYDDLPPLDGSRLTSCVKYGTCTLSVSTSPSGGRGGSVTCSSFCSSRYDYGTSVTATATPYSGYRFVRWSGASSSTNSSISITVDGNKTLIAEFEQITYILTTNVSPSEGGSVSPSYSSYASGTSVTVTASPNTGYRFVGWSGDLSSTSTSVTITMDGNKTLTAGFAQYSPPSYSNTYRTVTIGTQVWMAENLNYNAAGSKCYDNQESNCTTYGRLYDWATAMAFSSSCNSNSCSSLITTKHQGICPTGWHIPTQAEWNTLSSYVENAQGCSSCDAKHLKATSGWYNSGNGEDTYGFVALQSGIGYSNGNFYSIGNSGGWQSATEGNADSAYYRGMNWRDEYAYWSNFYKTYLHSVRCVMD